MSKSLVLKKTNKKRTKNVKKKIQFNQIFFSESSGFCERKSEWAIRSKKTRNSLICSFLWATWATSLIEKEGISKSHVLKNLQKNVLTKFHFSQICWANRLLFVSKRANERFAQKNEQFAHLLVYNERLERIAHGGSFDMSDLSNSLTVAHLSWAIWANRSQLLIWFERSEWMSEWANSQP